MSQSREKVMKHIVFLGDSLSDEGDMDHRKLFGVIPMADLSGLDDSPLGRFTNGFTWTDDFTLHQIENFIVDIISQEWTVDRLEKLGFSKDGSIAKLLLCEDYCVRNDREAIAKAFQDEAKGLTGKTPLFNFLKYCFTLNDYRYVRFLGADFVRNYAQGGLTAHNWRHSLTDLEVQKPIDSAKAFGARETVENLDVIRAKVFRYDAKNSVTAQQKQETLVFEWSGANDLITVNVEPLEDAAEKAVKARINNLEQMIKAGYRQFVLIDMPNLKLTPRFQAMSPAAQDQAEAVCKKFNADLRHQIDALKSKLIAEDPSLAGSLQVTIFDAFGAFQDIYDNAPALGFEVVKTPYVDSKGFDPKTVDSEKASKYMFWNDVHPSAAMHKILSQKALELVQEKGYQFESPATFSAESICVQHFLSKYDLKYIADKGSCFGHFKNSQLSRDNLTLKDIFKHALSSGGDRSLHWWHKHKGDRTLGLLRKMQWLDNDGQLTEQAKSSPIMCQAYESAQRDLDPSQAQQLEVIPGFSAA